MKKIFLSIISVFMIMCCVTPNFVFAAQFSDNETNTMMEVDIPGVPSTGNKDEKEDSGPNTVILTECGSDGNSIECILRNVVDIMTAGVGILAVVGIAWVGIQYITSGGNEAKMATAKKRIVEIVIGLFLYAVLYVVLKFLLPGFSGV